MIRKEIKEDGTFGGNYSLEIAYVNLPEKLIEITKEKAHEIDNDIDRFKYINEEIVDISDTQEYLDKQSQKSKEIQIADFKSQIEELDKKRIRAIAEPQLKDAQSGETWLEYYTQQIIALRAQIASL